MVINVSRQAAYGGKFVADIAKLPGMPPIGVGDTEWEAIAILLFRIMGDMKTWKVYLDLDELKVVSLDKEKS